MLEFLLGVPGMSVLLLLTRGTCGSRKQHVGFCIGTRNLRVLPRIEPSKIVKFYAFNLSMFIVFFFIRNFLSLLALYR